MTVRDLEAHLSRTPVGTPHQDERGYLFFAYTSDYLTAACRELRTLI
jgi:hypothetical protein